MAVDWGHSAGASGGAAGGGGATAALGCSSGSIALWDLERGRKLQVRGDGILILPASPLRPWLTPVASTSGGSEIHYLTPLRFSKGTVRKSVPFVFLHPLQQQLQQEEAQAIGPSSVGIAAARFTPGTRGPLHPRAAYQASGKACWA